MYTPKCKRFLPNLRKWNPSDTLKENILGIIECLIGCCLLNDVLLKFWQRTFVRCLNLIWKEKGLYVQNILSCIVRKNPKIANIWHNFHNLTCDYIITVQLQISHSYHVQIIVKPCSWKSSPANIVFILYWCLWTFAFCVLLEYTFHQQIKEGVQQHACSY